jgi:hypothetical protein
MCISCYVQCCTEEAWLWYLWRWILITVNIQIFNPKNTTTRHDLSVFQCGMKWSQD